MIPDFLNAGPPKSLIQIANETGLPYTYVRKALNRAVSYGEVVKFPSPPKHFPSSQNGYVKRGRSPLYRTNPCHPSFLK